MKVKNIMFSGFMAAVLAGACGAADAATVLASKEFVTTELGKKQDTLQQGDNIVIEGNKISAVQYDATALTQKVAGLETTIGNADGGLVKEVAGIKDVIDTLGDAQGVATLTNDVSDLKEAMVGLPADTTVAEAIADAVKDKQDKLTFDATPTENSANPVTSGGVYTALSGKADVDDIPTVPTNVSAFANDANYVTSTELTNKGYQTAENVATAIGNANIAMEKVTGLNTALGEKAAASDVESLQTTVNGLADKAVTTENMAAKLDGYATDAELDAVSGVANTAKTTADAAKATAEAALPAATFTTFQQTVNAEAIAEAKKAGTDAAEALDTYKGEVADALDAKVDDTALNNYYTKSEADTQFLEDAGLENGAAYLVTKDASGKVVYSEVSVIDGNGDTVIGKAQQ